MTVAAQIAVGPLFAYHFLQISVVGLAANLIVIPLVALLVPAGFAVAVVGAVIPTLGVSLAPVLGPPADAVRWTAAVFARLPLSAVPVEAPSLLGIAGFYAVLVATVERLRGRVRVTRAAVVAAVSGAVALALWAQVFAATVPPQLVITFLDVGRGGSIVVQAPSGGGMLVGGGGEGDGGRPGGARPGVPAEVRGGMWVMGPRRPCSIPAIR